MWMKPISPCCKPDGIMIQFLFTGKGISLRKEEKCASLSKAGLSVGCSEMNAWGRKQAVILSYVKTERLDRNQKVRETEVTVRK